MKEKIKDLLKESDVKLPKLLLYNYKSLNINELDLIILIYLINLSDSEFNPNKISEDLNMKLLDVMVNIDNLTKNDIIKIETKKEDNIHKDIINLDQLYEKLVYLIINEKEEKNYEDIYSTFEKEFGRTFSSMEFEIINSWLDTGYEKELIIAALKEAVYNRVFKLNYIDRILYEWSKKGIKTTEDINKDKENFNKKKEKKEELYDYNWLEDE